MLSLGMEFGVHDKEKEDLLEQVANMAGKGVLELVLPEGTVASGTDIRLSGIPSIQRKINDGGDSENTGFLAGVRTPIQRLIMGEYGIHFFRGFKKEVQKRKFHESEYVIYGKEKGKDDLSSIAARLAASREGLNPVRILPGSGKRQEARSLALTIVGGTGIPPLISVVASFIMVVWALGEVLLDMRCLLGGKKAPVARTTSDWKIDLAGLLEMRRSGCLINGEGGDGNGSGIDHEGHLRILIFGDYDADLIYRMMDITQVATTRKQPGFSLANRVYTVSVGVLVSGKHVFLSNGLWESQEREEGHTYDTRMAVAGSYLEDYKSSQISQR